MELVPEISIILPCLNEEAAIITCLEEIRKTVTTHSLNVEVIVVDNNSNDSSAKLVKDFQTNFPPLRLIQEKKEGYGFTYLKGFDNARGKYIFMADSDGSYDFSDIPRFIAPLRAGADLVIGNRFAQKISAGVMPWSHRYIGNPFLSFLVRLFFGVNISDTHCGARAISQTARKEINLCTGGMEFASEMIIKAARKNLKIVEIPIAYRERLGESKLHSMTDGWRHLRFILLYSPLLLFFLPGLLLFLPGIGLMILFYFSNPIIFGVEFYVHPMFLFSVMIILGYQLILFGGFSKIYAITHLEDTNHFLESLFRHITIEKTSLLGLIMASAGAIIYLSIFNSWVGSHFGALRGIKESVIGLTLLVVGIQTFFAAFMFSILGIKNK